VSQHDSHEPVTAHRQTAYRSETGEIRPRTRGAKVPSRRLDRPPVGRLRKPPRPGPRQGRCVCGRRITELKSTLQRVKAEYDNYRKRALRDQQLTPSEPGPRRHPAAAVLDDLERAPATATWSQGL